MVSTVYNTQYGSFIRESLNRTYLNNTELSQIDEIEVRYTCPFCDQINQITFGTDLVSPAVDWYTTTHSYSEKILFTLFSYLPFKKKHLNKTWFSNPTELTFIHTCELYPKNIELSLTEFPHPIAFEQLESKLSNMVAARSLGETIFEVDSNWRLFFSKPFQYFTTLLQGLGTLGFSLALIGIILQSSWWRLPLFSGILLFVANSIQKYIKYRYLPVDTTSKISLSELPSYEDFIKWGYEKSERDSR